MSLKIEINGTGIFDIPSFYAEINRVFMEGEDWQLGSSLDALNDLLYGGYGTLKDAETAEIIWNDSEVSKDALGFDTTKAFYLNKLNPESPFDKPYIRSKLEELEHGTGQTYFEIIQEIFEEHPNVRLILK